MAFELGAVDLLVWDMWDRSVAQCEVEMQGLMYIYIYTYVNVHISICMYIHMYVLKDDIV